MKSPTHNKQKSKTVILEKEYFPQLGMVEDTSALCLPADTVVEVTRVTKPRRSTKSLPKSLR